MSHHISPTDRIETLINVTRDGGILHRNGITAVDKIADFVDASVTIADNGAGTGSLAQSTDHYVTAIPGNRYGSCKVNTNIDTLNTAAYGADTGSIRVTIAQAVGAEWYDLFLSTDVAPKWVARVTEAQRAAGDFEVTAVATVAAGGGNPAGTVDINVVGTGIQTSNAIFSANNAYRPDTVTAIDCTGRFYAHIQVQLTVTDLRSAPTLAVVPFMVSQISGNYYADGREPIVLLSDLGLPLLRDCDLVIDGSTGLVLLVDTISGQGASCSIWVELA